MLTASPHDFMKMIEECVECKKPNEYVDFLGRCYACFEELKWRDSKSKQAAVYFKEMGVENPTDAKGSTAHVRDIKNRRYDPKTNETFYHKPKKTYFFPKGA